MTRILNAIYVFLAIGALFGAFFLLSEQGIEENKKQSTVLVNGYIIPVVVVDTDFLRNKGLSGTKSLEQQTGMFFIFDHRGKYGFWMKEMNYSIDIIWIDEEMRAVDILENVGPQTYPKVFYPSSESLYVLELNAFEARKMQISKGVKLELEKHF